jgi:hypothetical protein
VTTPQRHFVDVWNPSYASNAMEAHLAVLLSADQEYVWWGKVRSSNRQQPLRHLAAALEIGAELEADQDREGHLYLTDYRSLYVAHIDTITPGEEVPADPATVPARTTRTTGSTATSGTSSSTSAAWWPTTPSRSSPS